MSRNFFAVQQRLHERCARHILLAAAAALVLTACSKPAPPVDDVRPVRVLTIASSPVSVAAELSGEIRPRIESRLGFQVAGRIARRDVEVGQAVKKGQVLAALDPSDYKLSAAAANAQQAGARVERDQQRADFKRSQELQQQGFISEAELERRKSLLDGAEARYNSIAAQADVSSNQANYSVLRATSDGVVTAVDAEMGQVVSAGQTVLRVAQLREKEVAVSLPENQLAVLRRISDARVVLWASGETLRGRVREIAPSADPATRTFAARVTLIDAPPTVALGMTASVIFEAPLAQSVVRLPLQSLLREGDATYVWLLDATSMTVRRSAVQVATLNGNDVVIASGVKPGDTVVTAGVHLLKEGQKVKTLDAGSSSLATLQAQR